MKFFSVEVSPTPGSVCSASMKGETSARAVRQVLLGEREIKKLFSG